MTSPVITVGINNSIEHAWELFTRKQIRHLPVVSDQGALVGILSDRDFIGLGFSFDTGISISRSEQMALPVKEIMTTDVLTTRPSTELRVIAETMLSQHISAMPIVEDSGRLVGILTTNDILRTFVQKPTTDFWG